MTGDIDQITDDIFLLQYSRNCFMCEGENIFSFQEKKINKLKNICNILAKYSVVVDCLYLPVHNPEDPQDG